MGALPVVTALRSVKAAKLLSTTQVYLQQGLSDDSDSTLLYILFGFIGILVVVIAVSVCICLKTKARKASSSQEHAAQAAAGSGFSPAVAKGTGVVQMKPRATNIQPVPMLRDVQTVATAPFIPTGQDIRAPIPLGPRKSVTKD